MFCGKQFACRAGLAFISIIVLSSGVDVARADARVNPGEWKMSMKTKIKGLGIPLPAIPVKFTSCITQKDPVAETPEMRKAGCKIIDPKVDGGHVTYTGRCVSGESVTETYYKLTYEGDEMSGTFDQVRKLGGQTQSTATGTISGKRLGDCKN